MIIKNLEGTILLRKLVIAYKKILNNVVKTVFHHLILFGYVK